MTKHYFSPEVAQEAGINAAVIFERLAFWINHNKRKGKNFKDGTHWTYSTQKEIAEQFPYLTLKQTRTAVDKLIAAGFIKTGNFNRHKYDKTRWIALTEKGEAVSPPGKKIVPLRAKGNTGKGEPIPVINKQLKIKGIDKERIEHIRKICGIV